MPKGKTIVVMKFMGSRGWLWFWIFVFWPIALAYYFLNRRSVEVRIQKEKKNYFAKTAFANSFKGNGQKYLYSVVFDLIFLLATFLITRLFSWISTFLNTPDKINELRAQISQAALLSSGEEAAKYTRELYSFLILTLVYFIIFMLVMVLNWSVFRAFIYSTIYDAKLNMKRIAKFYLANVIVGLGAFLLLVLGLYALKPQISKWFIIVIFLVLGYLIIIFYNTFFIKEKVKEAMRFAFYLGFKRIKTMLPAFIIMAALGAAFIFATSGLGSLVGERSGAVSLIALAIYLGWARLYIYTIIKQKILKPSRAK